jgi:hypothetical protein
MKKEKPMKAARVIFYIEVLLNLYAAKGLFLSPGSYLRNFHRGPEQVPAPALEMIRWYGVIVLSLSYLELRALASRNDAALAVAQEALLLSDVLQLGACYQMSRATGRWLRTTTVTAGLAVLLAAVRLYWLHSWRQRQKREDPANPAA